MKVCLGSFGRFHTFNLGQELERRGYLTKLYTAYPKWKVDGLPLIKVRTFPWVFGLSTMAYKLSLYSLQERLNQTAIKTYDRWMAHQLEQCSVFHCLSSFGTLSHEVAKSKFGALTICDRGSSHIVYQNEILKEEYSLWGIPYRPIDRFIIERETEEYQKCDLVFVPSAYVLNSFLEKGVPREKIVKIPYGVNLKMFKPIGSKENKIFRVIFAGALCLRKGIQYLLKAIALLKLPDFEVWFCGGVTPEIKPILGKYKDKFRHFGMIPRHKLPYYYSQSSVFVLPSIEEGLALVQAQAMACALPVIATTHTGAQDLFSDGKEGFIIPIRDPEAIKEKILFLYEHPEVREEMGKAALTKVQSLGGWSTYGEQVIKTYEAYYKHIK